MKKTIITLGTILAALVPVNETEAKDLTLLNEVKNQTNEVQVYTGNNIKGISFEQYLELQKGNMYGETGVQMPLISGLQLAGEYTSIEGVSDHLREGVMYTGEIAGIDLLVRAMVDNEQGFHGRLTASKDVSGISLTYNLVDMDGHGYSHHRFTIDKKLLDNAVALAEARFGPDEKPTFYVGVGLR